MPEEHRAAARLVKQADDELARASTLWRRYVARSVSQRLVLSVGLAAPVVVTVAHLVALLRNLDVVAADLTGRQLVALFGWLPGAALLGVWIGLFWYGESGDGMRALTSTFAAIRGSLAPMCRSCGAPLAVAPGAVFVRCAYCRTDSLVELGEVERYALAQDRARACTHASEAIEAERVRRDGAVGGAQAAGVFVGPGILLPLVWALLPAGSQHSFGIAFASWGVMLAAMILGFAPLAGGPGVRSRSADPRVLAAMIVIAFAITGLHIAIAATES